MKRTTPSPPSDAALERLLLVHSVRCNARRRRGSTLAIVRCACDLCARAEARLGGA